MDASPGHERTDPQLLARARKDPDAFKLFYDRHSLTLGSWLRRKTGDTEVAADLTAEAFAQAWFSIKRFKGSDDDAEAGVRWLFGIAKNLLGTYYRKQKVEAAGRVKLGMSIVDDSSDVYERVDERASAELDGPALDDAISALPEEQWEALELRIVSQLPYTEVAQQLGCSENAARLRVSRALGAMRLSMAEEQRV